MNAFIPLGYLTLEDALIRFGKRKFPDDWEVKKTASRQEFQQLLFAKRVPAKVLTDAGDIKPLPSSDWGASRANRILETGRAPVSIGSYYFPETAYYRVLIEESAIDALFDAEADVSEDWHENAYDVAREIKNQHPTWGQRPIAEEVKNRLSIDMVAADSIRQWLNRKHPGWSA